MTTSSGFLQEVFVAYHGTSPDCAEEIARGGLIISTIHREGREARAGYTVYIGWTCALIFFLPIVKACTFLEI